MPRTTRPHPLLAPLHQRATKALALLHRHIAQRERELAALKAEAARWQRAVNERAQRTSAAALPTRASRTKRRRDWRAILAGLPRTFSAREVATKAGKPIAQVYVHVSHWMKDKKVRKVEDGYQKVSRVA